MTQEELNKILENHRKWLNNEDGGVYADLSHTCLKEADLSGANLREVNLIGANLIEANLVGAYLYNANLKDANLKNANLSDTNLMSTNLVGTYLYGANLSGAYLTGAVGNNREVKLLQLGKYYTTILVGIKIHIGCECHTIEQWENFTDKEISEMDDGALDWWKKWKEVILKVAKGE